MAAFNDETDEILQVLSYISGAGDKEAQCKTLDKLKQMMEKTPGPAAGGCTPLDSGDGHDTDGDDDGSAAPPID